MATELVIVASYNDPPVSRDEIEEAICYHNRYAMKMPAHWVDRKRAAHQRINDLLDQWETTPE